jgi:branched-chain amino acid transport system ATP-binding protein
MTLLSVEGLCAGYGDFQALFDVDVRVGTGETVAIIGANGAGKSTLLGAIAGAVDVTAGHIRFEGRDLAHEPADRRVRSGIALVPEGRRLFPSMSTRENLLIGSYAGRPGPWSLGRVLDLFPLLGSILDRPAHVLSGGERQVTAIGRALMANPALLLLDEASLGLAPIVVHRIYQRLPDITAAGTTALVVEQDISQALAVATRVYCLLEGRVSLVGEPADLDRDQITRAYFGAFDQEVPSWRG